MAVVAQAPFGTNLCDVLPVNDHLDAILSECAPLLVAYSGGVDSAFLMMRAHALLGRERSCAILADSPSLARVELEAARRLAEERGWNLRVVQTREFEDPNYIANPPNRCFFCKTALFTIMQNLAKAEGWKTLAYGENVDDQPQDRPGHRAATDFRVRSPLREAGWTKAAIREAARAAGLPVADKPASPCLASRIPHGTPVSEVALDRVERAEQSLRERGFRIFRVRHHGDRARLEFGRGELDRYHALAKDILADLQMIGYTTVELHSVPYGEPVTPSL
jgi:uncharacterized protein